MNSWKWYGIAVNRLAPGRRQEFEVCLVRSVVLFARSPCYCVYRFQQHLVSNAIIVVDGKYLGWHRPARRAEVNRSALGVQTLLAECALSHVDQQRHVVASVAAANVVAIAIVSNVVQQQASACKVQTRANARQSTSKAPLRANEAIDCRERW
jgi:hypothetical protein